MAMYSNISVSGLMAAIIESKTRSAGPGISHTHTHAHTHPSPLQGPPPPLSPCLSLSRACALTCVASRFEFKWQYDLNSLCGRGAWQLLVSVFVCAHSSSLPPSSPHFLALRQGELGLYWICLLIGLAVAFLSFLPFLSVPFRSPALLFMCAILSLFHFLACPDYSCCHCPLWCGHFSMTLATLWGSLRRCALVEFHFHRSLLSHFSATFSSIFVSIFISILLHTSTGAQVFPDSSALPPPLSFLFHILLTPLLCCCCCCSCRF